MGELAAGLAALVALYAVWRLARRSWRLPGVERVALAGLAAATLGWVVEIRIRTSLVVDAASTGDTTALSDATLTGAGVFLALTSLASALLVRSDPVASTLDPRNERSRP